MLREVQTMNGARLNGRETIRAVLREVGDAVGPERLRSIATRSAERMGEGGTPIQWLESIALVIAQDTDEVAMQAMTRALCRL